MQGSQGNPLTITTQDRVIAIKTNGEANINAQYAQITANTSTGILVSPAQTNNNIDLDSTTIAAEVGIVNTGELQRLDIDSASKVGATANGGINGQAIVNGQSVLNGQSYETTGTANRIGVLNNEGTIEGDRYGVVNSGVDKKSRIDNLTNANTGTIKVTGASATAIYNGNDLNQNGSGLDYIVTITNKGRIEGTANGIANLGQIDTIDNDSGITGSKAIYMADTGAILGTLDNDGQIVGTAVAIENDGTITTITNKGTIQGATTAIDNDGSITTLSLHRNSQLTSNSTGSLIDNDGTITTLENNSNLNGANIIIDNAKDIGTIENFHNINGNNNAINHTAGTITKLDNKAAGTISGNQAINIANGATITDLTNSGTIESRNGAAIGNDGTITNLNLQATSQLIGSNNVMIDNRNTITNLTNNSNLNGDKAIINRNTIGTLTNNKTINGTDNAIEIAANATIDTLTNAANAIITGANQAIEIIANATIGTLTNSGKIESTNNAAIDNDGSITTLELEQDSELISNVAHSLIDNDGTITTLRNRANLNSNNIAIDNAKDIGTIENHNIISGTNNAINHTAGTITNLNNEAGATILGNQAIAIANGALITTLNNSGTIESKNGAVIDNKGTIENLNLKTNSKLVGTDVMIDNKNIITNLTNETDLSGTIAIKNSSTIDNIINHLTISGTDKAIDHTAGTIATLENKAGAKISGVNQTIAIATGATIENFTNAGDIDGKISIYNNGTIGTLDNSGNISGDIYNTSPNTLRVLKNSGSMGNIYNTATGVMGTDNGDNALENKNSIKSINNAGTIKAKMYAIKNDSGSINDIVNEGKIIFKEKNGAQIYNDGTATAAISKWNIKLNQDAKDYNDLTKIDTTNGNEKIVDERIFVGGNKLDGIKFGKEAIVLTLGPDGGLGEYDLGALVVKNNGGNAWVSAATEVTGVSDDGQYTEQLGITCANLRFDDTGLLVAKCSNNRIDISADLDKSIAADLPSVWVNNYIMSSTIRNSIISDIMMSSIGLLQGDDSGRSDQEEKKEGWHIFAIPYANYSWQSVYGGKAHTYTYGIMSGWAKNLNEYGVIGGFVGYENSDTDMPRRNEIDSNTRYIGGSYYNEFPINSIAHPYVKAVASYTNSNPNIYTKTDSADTYLNTVSAGVAAGLNIYLGKDVIIPEVGIDYNYFKMGSYTLGSERYGRSSLKLPIVNGSLGWQRDYGNNFYTMLKGGVKHLLEDTHETPIKYGIKYNDKYSEKYSGDVKSDMPTTIGTISAGLGYNFNSNTNLTLNYQGGFAKDTRSHTGTAKIEYRF